MRADMIYNRKNHIRVDVIRAAINVGRIEHMTINNKMRWSNSLLDKT